MRRKQLLSSKLMIGVAVPLAALVVTGSARAEPQPLDPFDPTPRAILVERENSLSPGVVGQSYALPVEASYSVSGSTGTVSISIESHEQMRAGLLMPIAGSFTPIVIEIELNDLSASSQSASGAMQGGGFAGAFTQHPLGTDALAGYVTGDVTPVFCTSQQQVDDACLIDPLYCNQICVIVPGAPYDPATGKVNLVGPETREGCSGTSCFGPLSFFSEAGDLRLTEVPPPTVPALPLPAAAALGACLLLSTSRLASRGSGRRISPAARQE